MAARGVVLAVLVVWALLQGSCGKITWKPCGSPELYFSWDDMKMLPDPAILGERLTVDIMGRALGEDILPHPGLATSHGQDASRESLSQRMAFDSMRTRDSDVTCQAKESQEVTSRLGLHTKAH